MMPSKATAWNATPGAQRSSNDNGRPPLESGPTSIPAQSGVTRIAIAGPIEEGLIASLLQMWANAASTGKLEVCAGREQGQIELRHGSIVHARLGFSLGQAACFRILSLRDGEFRYHAEHRDEAEPTPEEKAAARADVQELLFAWVRLARGE